MAEHVYETIRAALENDILEGIIREGEPIPSTHRLADYYKVNPATAAKGVALLNEDGLLDKKRGLGLFLAEGARQRLLEKRRGGFRARYVDTMLAEAARLGIPQRDVVAMAAARQEEKR
jgi:DNA-binding transcriptional regulator YhcF (GntR family)